MLHADSVSVGSVEIDSYKDRNQLQSPAFRQMLYTSVQRIPVGIDFPVIDARGINIRYEEVSKGATVPGVVTFTDMDARITGLTNRPQKPTQQYRITPKGTCSAELSSKPPSLSPPTAATTAFRSRRR